MQQFQLHKYQFFPNLKIVFLFYFFNCFLLQNTYVIQAINTFLFNLQLIKIYRHLHKLLDFKFENPSVCMYFVLLKYYLVLCLCEIFSLLKANYRFLLFDLKTLLFIPILFLLYSITFLLFLIINYFQYIPCKSLSQI